MRKLSLIQIILCLSTTLFLGFRLNAETRTSLAPLSSGLTQAQQEAFKGSQALHGMPSLGVNVDPGTGLLSMT